MHLQSRAPQHPSESTPQIAHQFTPHNAVLDEHKRYACRMVYNTHEREISAPQIEVGLLIDSLASKQDRLWPCQEWPAIRLNGPLGVGAAGGHGPVRYFVTAYELGRRVEFRFTGPSGFNGAHAFTATGLTSDTTLLKHELTLSPKGTARVTWPLFFRPMHDALIEESLDLAETECGAPPMNKHRRSLWTKLLRTPFSAQLSGKSKHQ